MRGLMPIYTAASMSRVTIRHDSNALILKVNRWLHQCPVGGHQHSSPASRSSAGDVRPDGSRRGCAAPTRGADATWTRTLGSTL